MPSWGRPPGGEERRRREWERQAQDWDELHRFQELGSDESDEDGVDLDPSNFAGDELRFTGYDVASARQGRRPAAYDDLAYGDDYEGDEEQYEMRRGEWQLAMKAKEDELVETAERRMYRARLRGESDVALTREEIDALERKRLRQEGKSVVRTPKAIKETAVTKPKRKAGGGLFGFGAPPPKSKGSKSTGKKMAPSLHDSSPGPSSGAASPDLRSESSQGPLGYYALPSGRMGNSPSKRSSRQSSAAALRQPGAPPLVQYDERFTNRHSSAPDGFRPTSSPSSRGSPTRSLPDDPDWQPRSRSSSSSQLYSGDPLAYQPGPYMQGRRNQSGPAGVSYSSLRRVPPPGASRAPVQASSDHTLLPRTNSGLSNELVEISSDEEESDEGVRVDVVEDGSASGYAVRTSQVSGRNWKGRR